jgi:dTDP-4-dehydrorhamnose 3,5-epimerase
VLRGLHFHRKQADLWQVVAGRTLCVLADVRAWSAGRSVAVETVELSADKPQLLYIPRGVAHGFQALEDCALQYLVDEYYDGADEHGIRFDEPLLGVTWPIVPPILSRRDHANPALGAINSALLRF